jgi:hypothetical protein
VYCRYTSRNRSLESALPRVSLSVSFPACDNPFHWSYVRRMPAKYFKFGVESRKTEKERETCLLRDSNPVPVSYPIVDWICTPEQQHPSTASRQIAAAAGRGETSPSVTDEQTPDVNPVCRNQLRSCSTERL